MNTAKAKRQTFKDGFLSKADQGEERSTHGVVDES